MQETKLFDLIWKVYAVNSVTVIMKVKGSNKPAENRGRLEGIIFHSIYGS